MTPRTRIPLYLLLVLIFGGWQLASGQANTAGSLTGTVTDPSGALVSGASLTLTQPSTGFHRSTTANSTGLYSFPELQPGQYILKATASGFADSVYNGVTVQTGRTLDLAVQMKLGTSQQTVDVSETGEVLETTTNTLATTISTEAIQDLPLNGRDSLPFAQLVSGAQSGGDQRFETYNAMPAAALNITVDGMTNNFQRYKTATSAFFNPAPLRIDAVDEFTVSTSDLSADAGAEGGATLRFSLKHGTNQFHGKAFWQTQNSAFNANTYFNNAQVPPIGKVKYHLSDFGASLGGPFWKNKLFFFVNYEQEYVPGNQQGFAQVLTNDAQGGAFTYTGTDNQVHTVNVLDIAAANGFPSTVNPLVKSEFSQINSATAKAVSSTTTQLPYQTQYTWFYRANSNQIYPTARIDYQIRPNIDWHVAYDVSWSTYPNSEIYPGDPYTNGSFNATYSTFTTGLTWTLTPHLVNQLNAGLLNTQEEFNVGHSFTPFGPENNIIIQAPTFVNGYNALGPYLPNYYLPEPRNSPVRDVNDLVTWTHGKHSFTFGGEYRDATDFDTGEDDPAGYYLGSSSGLDQADPALHMFNSTNFPFLDLSQSNNQDLYNAENLYATLTGRVYKISGQNYVDAQTHQYQTLGIFKQPEQQLVGGFYIQDAWRPTAHLALNYGFRWQFSGAIHNTNNTYTGPTYADLLGPSKELFHPGVDGSTNPQINLRPSPYKGDMREPAPNFGFAWNPSFSGDGWLAKLAGGSKLVVRGGGGVTWYDEGWITFEQVSEFSNPGDTQNATLTSGPLTNTPAGEFPSGSLTLGAQPALSLAPTSFSFPVPESNFTFTGQPFATVDPRIRSPYIENWYFGLQRQLPGNTVFEVNYVGNHSVHEWQVYDLNEINIFENGFLNEFKAAQANLAASGGATFAGSNPTPIMNQAFGGAGSAPFTNPGNIGLVQQGQAGALANVIASNSTFFCNLVGNGGGVFTPCANHPATQYPINIFQANPFATGQPIQSLSDPGSGTYNGLQAQIKHPTGHGLMLTANYAFSHSFTNRYIGDYYTADAAEYNFTTLRNPRLNRSPSPYDYRHTFRAFAVYNLPFHSQSFAVNEIASGWTLSPIFQWTTGRNFKLLGGTNTYNYYDSPYPDASDSGVVLNGITPKELQNNVGYYPGPSSQYPRLLMNPKVFSSGQVTPEATPGQLGQFVFLHGPQVINTDFAVTKAFPIYHEVKMSIQAEMLNLFNHPQWAVVDGNSGGTNNPAQYVTVSNFPAVPATQTNPQGLRSNGARDIQFRAQIVF